MPLRHLESSLSDEKPAQPQVDSAVNQIALIAKVTHFIQADSSIAPASISKLSLSSASTTPEPQLVIPKKKKKPVAKPQLVTKHCRA